MTGTLTLGSRWHAVWRAAPHRGGVIFVRGTASRAINVAGSLLTFLAGLSVSAFSCGRRRELVFIDDFNIYLVALTTFVAFGRLFSASYIDQRSDRAADAGAAAFYHAMYQVQPTCCWARRVTTSRHVGSVEGATLAPSYVSLYRTHQAIEAPGNTSSSAASASRSPLRHHSPLLARSR